MKKKIDLKSVWWGDLQEIKKRGYNPWTLEKTAKNRRVKKMPYDKLKLNVTKKETGKTEQVVVDQKGFEGLLKREREDKDIEVTCERGLPFGNMKIMND